MFFKGMSFGFMAPNGYYASAAGRQEIQNIINAGADSVALMVTVMQDTFASTRMYRDFILTPSDIEVCEAIRTFRQAGVKIMLKPIMQIHDSTHRCEINFPENQELIAGIVTDYWGEWFKNYTACMVHYARICELEGVEMLCLGCEMVGADKREKYWPPLIEAVRKVYKGLLSYNTPSWWDYEMGQKWTREWFKLLDQLGVSVYYGMPEECNTVDSMAEQMKYLADNLEQASRELGVPIFMAELGCRSVINGHIKPSDCWNNQNEFDGEIQATYLSAICKAFYDREWWTGFFWWKWEEQQNRPHFHKASGDTGCTIAGKPAEKTFHDWIPPVR